MRISDWSSDVCSSDLNMMGIEILGRNALWGNPRRKMQELIDNPQGEIPPLHRYAILGNLFVPNAVMVMHPHHIEFWTIYQNPDNVAACRVHLRYLTPSGEHDARGIERSEEQTSELQSLMSISYAVLC